MQAHFCLQQKQRQLVEKQKRTRGLLDEVEKHLKGQYQGNNRIWMLLT